MECVVKCDSQMTSRISSCFFFWSSSSGGSAVMSEGTKTSCENCLSVPSWKQIIRSVSSHQMAPTLAIIFVKKIFIGCAGPLLLHRLSLVVVSRGYSLLQCLGFSLRWSLLLWSTGSRSKGFSRCSSWALQHRLNSCGAWAYLFPSIWDLPGPGMETMSLWDLPGPGMETMSPAFSGRFFTIKPSGKPLTIILIEPHERICIESTT